MKLHKNLLFGIIASVLCLCDASAAKNKSCPPGCFCIKEGRYQPGSGIFNHKNTSDMCKSSSYKINDATADLSSGEWITENDILADLLNKWICDSICISLNKVIVRPCTETVSLTYKPVL